MTDVIAFYLPQFHPIPENDKWWYRGFTEWTVLRAAAPLYRGHQQPLQTSELGEYDLLEPRTHAIQAELASEYGVSSFCYWTYWSSGRRLLERPVEIAAGLKLPIQYCLGWANHHWTRVWQGNPREVLRKQTYGGAGDANALYDYLEQHFRNQRYTRVDGRPLLYLYRPTEVVDLATYLEVWADRATKSGGRPPFVVGECHPRQRTHPNVLLLDSTVEVNWQESLGLVAAVRKRVGLGPSVVSFASFSEKLTRRYEQPGTDPWIMVGWDNTPRRGRGGWVLSGAEPQAIEAQAAAAVRALESRDRRDRRIWVKSWNEWSEGNHLEPDRHRERSRLEALGRGLGAGR